MTDKVRQYYESLNGKRVFLLGAGLSHRQLVEKFARYGAKITLCDRRTDLGEEYSELLAKSHADTMLGDEYLAHLDEADIIFRTPGIDYTKPEIQAAVKAGKHITSEMETFFDLCEAKKIGVTGSDGKTTTTTLIAKILENSGFTIHLGGNIGRPLLPIIDDISPDDIAVVELSSFQLISMKTSPDISLVTNVVPNHLDHHKDMQEYIDAKRNIITHQNENGITVLNLGNDITRTMISDVKGTLRLFARQPVENGAYIDGDSLYTARNGVAERFMNFDGIRLVGQHNRENIAAAVAVTMELADRDRTVETIRNFNGVEHRIELVREFNGAKWYNDSIATTPTRTIAGLRSFDEKVILIAGGSDKKLSYDPLAPDILKHVKTLLLCGTTAEAIEKSVRECDGFEQSDIELVRLENIPAAVGYAAEIAKRGDVVLLSPASPSFDSYANFEKRGEHFKKLVNELGTK